MNKTQNIAIIDIGKTNIKIVLVNLNSFTELIVLSEPNVVVNKGLYSWHLNTVSTQCLLRIPLKWGTSKLKLG